MYPLKYRLLCWLLILSLFVSSIANADTLPVLTLSDPNEQIISETILSEEIIYETILYPGILEETYIEELVLTETMVRELLIEEESINEVILCQTVYVPQEHIQEFAENSQTSSLFGDEINLSSILSKVAIGTGIIVTVVVLKKSGIPEPIASLVITPIVESTTQFAASGAALGTLYGGLTGATDEIDQSGRTSAVIGVAVAIAGLIISTVSLVAALPSGGTTGITAAAGVKMVFTGLSLVGTVSAGYNAYKTFTATDSCDIDWDNIDWEQVGVSAAQQAINYGADGYMWGAIAGAVYGGAQGYDNYHKYYTPYTEYAKRIGKTPKDGKKGHWNGERGESEFELNEPIKLANGKEIRSVKYQNGVPDFSPYAEAEVRIVGMTEDRLVNNYPKADEALAKMWSESRHNNRSWTATDIRQYRTENNLTWHEMSNMESMQLVPYEVNAQFTHYGGVSEYKAMTAQNGDDDFD